MIAQSMRGQSLLPRRGDIPILLNPQVCTGGGRACATLYAAVAYGGAEMSRKGSRGIFLYAKNRSARLGMIVCGLSLVAGCLVIRYYWGAEPASADPPAPSSVRTPAAHSPAVGRDATKTQSPSAAPSDSSSLPQVMAVVNGRQITRNELGLECLRHYGEEVLESLVNKLLIVQECKRRNVAITRAEVDAEIERLAQRFGLPKQQWLKMLKTERGINPAQYASDIIWPTLALRRLAGQRLDVTREELIQAYETKYGPAVRGRLIVCKDLQKANRVRAAAAADPDQFGNLAKEHSEDASASFKGLIQPIRKHGSYQEIEQAAFSMADGEVSQVIRAGGQYVILKREGLLPAQKVSFEQAAPQLEEMVRDRKLRATAQDVFRQLQDRSTIENVWNDPQRRRQMPGVAAVINGQQITVSQLAEQCIQRHGEEVLEGTINRRLIELACAKHRITVSEAEIDQEILRAAAESVPPKKDGSPDLQAWLKLVTEQQGVSVEVYRRDSVWPTVALKKLVGNKVEVTDEDLRKGYEANYGPRVRCLAIVLDNLHRAQQVWETARKNPTAEYFGELAAQYSIEPGSRALRGEVPPIQKHGGEPLLEKEAFDLKAGEISGIVQVGKQYVILFCQGRTEPVGVSFQEVREEVYRYIFEKKQRLAMAKYFQQLQENATIDNYLAGTSQSPTKSTGPKPTPKLPTLREVPP
jgi:parvulin-like peptidyl-prolyl isomerase